MSENKKKNKKCKIKCTQCEFYETPLDYCSQKDIRDCSKQVHINFSACEDFLVKEKLVMF